MTIALTQAWSHISDSYPNERLYAFGLFTTPDAVYFRPIALGEEGLTEIAKRYQASSNVEKTLDTHRQDLRWSYGDSPYMERLERYGRPIDEALEGRLDPYDDVAETKIAREIRDRLDAAVAALKALDQAGHFGEMRQTMLLVIEAGDRDDDWFDKLLKKLNPPGQVKAYLQQFDESQTYAGSFVELGTNKVYETTNFACTADRRLVATASEYVLCVFDVVERKQLMARPLPRRGDSRVVHDVCLSDDGTKLAAYCTQNDDATLCLLSGKDWKQQTDIQLPRKAVSLVGAPDGSWYAAGSEDNRVRVYDQYGKLVVSLEGFKDWPRGTAVSPDGALFAVAGHKSGLTLYRTQDWTKQHHMDTSADGVSFHPLKPLVMSTLRYGRDKTPTPIEVWDCETGLHQRTIDVPSFVVPCARFSPDGRWIAAGVQKADNNLHDEVVLIDASTGKAVDRFRNKFSWVNDVLFLPEQRAIAVGVKGYTMRPLILWSPQNW